MLVCTSEHHDLITSACLLPNFMMVHYDTINNCSLDNFFYHMFLMMNKQLKAC